MADIRISNHALLRMKERFRLTFPSHYFISKTSIINLMIGQISTAREVGGWKSVPFYLNMIQSKYGDITVFHRSGIYYVCRKENESLICVTVVKNWYFDLKDFS